MATDKDIKKFFKDSKPEISNSDEFMADLIRQINLLPVPASLNRRPDEAEVRREQNQLLQFAKSSRRNSIATILVSMLIALGVCAAAALLLPLLPDASITNTIMHYRMAVFSVLFTAITLGSCLNSDFFKV